METDIDLGTFDVEKFGESLAKAARENVKWELRKLQWILDEEKKENENESRKEAA